MANKFAGGIIPGSTSVTIPVVVLDSSGEGATGIGDAAATGASISALNVGVWRQGATPETFTPTKAASTTAAWTSGRWIEIDSLWHPGLYRLDLPDSVCATGADWVHLTIQFTGSATAPTHMFFPLHDEIGAADSAGVTTLLARLSSTRATLLDSIGADTPGTITLQNRLTATRAGYLDNIGANPPGVTDLLARLTETRAGYLDILQKINTALVADGGVWKFTANALSLAPVGTTLSAGDVTAAVWAAAQSGNTASGTMGRLLLDAQSTGNPWLATGLESYAPGTAGHKLASRLSVGRFLLAERERGK